MRTQLFDTKDELASVTMLMTLSAFGVTGRWNWTTWGPPRDKNLNRVELIELGVSTRLAMATRWGNESHS
jgi:hypothetical protein